MSQDAIHADANEDVNDERPLSAREQMMEQMGDRREQELTGATEEEPEAREPISDLVKVVVDGEEKELPLAEVVKGFQKDTVASKRLEEAAARKKELDEREAQLLSREDQLKKQSVAPEPEEEDDYLAQAVDGLVEGDTEATAEAIRKEIARALKKATPTISDEEIAKTVDSKLAEDEARKTQARIDEEHRTANAKFAEDYPEIIKDKYALAEANARFYDKIAEGKSISEAMADAGRETVEARSLSRRESRQQRKSQISSLPVVGARSVSRQDSDNAPQSKSDIIAEMRASRGLAT